MIKRAFWDGFEKRAGKEGKDPVKVFGLHNRKRWLNDPPAFTDSMSKKEFKKWVSSPQGRSYAKAEADE